MKHKPKYKICALDKQQRPGIARAFLKPAKLNFQLRDTPVSKLRFSPAGKTLYGGVQWSIGVVPMRPGIAAPVIVAKQDVRMSAPAARREMARAVEKGKPLGRGVANEMAARRAVKQAEALASKPGAAPGKAKGQAKAAAAKAAAAKAKAVAKAAGFGYWY